jgi:hypothetical protein
VIIFLLAAQRSKNYFTQSASKEVQNRQSAALKFKLCVAVICHFNAESRPAFYSLFTLWCHCILHLLTEEELESYGGENSLSLSEQF